MKKILKHLGIFFMLLVFAGLLLSGFVNLSGVKTIGNNRMPAMSYSDEYAYSESSLKSEGSNSIASDSSSRLVIRTGDVNMVVKDVAGVAKKITQYAENRGGWVVSSNLFERDNILSSSVIIKVPSEIFKEAMAYTQNLAEKVVYEKMQGRDVTEEYTDIQSQLRNLEATEEQLLKIMERSGSIPDVLSVQRELSKVRGQIEHAKGRIQYLEANTEMATITINLSLSESLLPIPSAEKWRPAYVFMQAWRNVLSFLRSISYFLIWITAYAIIWLPLLFIFRYRRKLLKK